MSDNLLQRTLVGVIFAPIIFFSAIYVKGIFALIVLVLIVGSLKEFFILLDAPDSSLYSNTGYVFGVLIYLDILFFGGSFIQYVLFAFAVILGGFFYFRRSATKLRAWQAPSRGRHPPGSFGSSSPNGSSSWTGPWAP